MSDAHPCHGPDPMAVRADYLAFRDFSFCLRNAFGIANVNLLAAANMVKLQSGRVRSIPAVHASAFQLVSIKPSANIVGALVGPKIYARSVARLFKAPLPPSFDLLRAELSLRAAAFAALIRAKLRSALCLKAPRAVTADELLSRRVFPWRHPSKVPSVAYPCKPDIFEKTYDPVSSDSP